MSKKSKQIIAVVSVMLILLIGVWAINNYINEKRLNEDKAELFDESLYASYAYLIDTNNSLFTLLNIYEEVALTAKEDTQQDFQESVKKFFFAALDNNPLYLKAYMKVDDNSLFLSTAVSNYLSDGGKLREKESDAYKHFAAVWAELSSEIRFEDYESLMNRINLFRGVLAESLPNMKTQLQSYSNDKDAWCRIKPMDKLYIWQRYNERKNWPFTFLNK